MDSRTCSKVIANVSDQLKFFTVAELFYVLQEDARLSLFDINRVKKITDRIRYRYGSEHSDEQVTTVIQLLGDIYAQTLPMQNELSLSFTSHRQSLNPIITPFSSVCFICQKSFDRFDAKQHPVKVYFANGSSVSGKFMTFVCNHRSCTTNSTSALINLYPNFVLQDDKHVYTHESLHCGLYVYVGGDVAIERAIIDKFTAEFIHKGSSIHSFVNSLNQEALNNDHLQLSEVDLHIISGILYRYLYIQLYLSMGNPTVSTPSRIAEYDMWAWKEFPRVLSCFTYLWMNHEKIIGSCNGQCSKCLVVDGHQKCRRRICGFKDVRINTDEMNQIVLGCCRTPISNNKYCDLHVKSVSDSGMNSQNKNTVKLKATRKKVELNKLNATSCRTTKERSDSYIKKCT
ncbi:unnamed protein product [Rotaria magnacalcarata]|uniref:Uncharacterized protein n=1 Tax=Rotaria magnacalcarata TaxID=392030 RepID=A0A815XU43_9BILA|nr:unnamed protein product [Rotaria magnacalcarata]CAF1562552.1 unnamed protein product [Rotaria magnacalcarata]CAF3803816.1 unnamed protein product [Rotaria magnacalcarata]CAF3839660.1 unnamed protein product [Rotaria magnacalcarata]